MRTINDALEKHKKPQNGLSVRCRSRVAAAGWQCEMRWYMVYQETQERVGKWVRASQVRTIFGGLTSASRLELPRFLLNNKRPTAAQSLPDYRYSKPQMSQVLVHPFIRNAQGKRD